MFSTLDDDFRSMNLSIILSMGSDAQGNRVNQQHNLTRIQVLLIGLPILPELKVRKVGSNPTVTPSTLAEEFTGTVECLGKGEIKLLQLWCNYQVSKVRRNVCKGF